MLAKFFAIIIWCSGTNCVVDYSPYLFETEEACVTSVLTEVSKNQEKAKQKGFYVYDAVCVPIQEKA